MQIELKWSIDDLDMIHVEANKSGMTSRVGKPGGHELVSFR